LYGQQLRANALNNTARVDMQFSRQPIYGGDKRGQFIAHNFSGDRVIVGI